MQTLCINCDNNQNCNWQNEYVSQCNEHLNITVINTTVTPKEKLLLKTNHTSLCDTCLYSSDCVFKKQELKTIFCEEYQ